MQFKSNGLVKWAFAFAKLHVVSREGIRRIRSDTVTLSKHKLLSPDGEKGLKKKPKDLE